MNDTTQPVIAHEEKLHELLIRLGTQLRSMPDLFSGTLPLISLRVICRFDRKTGDLLTTTLAPEYEDKGQESRAR